MVNVRDLKFYVSIPHEKIVDPYFFSCPSYAPFLSYFPWKTKFKNLVIFMPPTLKKLEGHIAFGLYVCLSVCLSVCVCVCTSVNF